MEKTNIKNCLLLLPICLMILFAGCSSSSTEGNPNGIPKDATARLYMLSGEFGTFVPAKDGNACHLTLANMAHEVRWISDRPERDSGTDEMIVFVRDVWPALYSTVPPNAVLKFLLATENEGLFLQLKEPAYDALKNTLDFTVTVLNTTLEEGDPRLSQRMELSSPVMVILDHGDGFNAVVYGEMADIENPQGEKAFTIFQKGMDGQVLWASGAPSTRSTVTDTAELARRWDTLFADSPPNAFIFGLTDGGEIQTVAATLDGMEYIPEDKSVSYSANNLAEGPVESRRLHWVTAIIDSDAGNTEERQIQIHNQVQLLSPCSGPSLTFFEGYTHVDIDAGEQKTITVQNMWGAYEIGFQINGWYWRCGGGSNCPNPKGCRNPDNAGQVAIRITPGQSAGACSAAELVRNYTLGVCDNNVPNASDVVTVTLEDPETCLVRVEASDLSSLAPTDNCCSCDTCTNPPPGQQTHCN